MITGNGYGSILYGYTPFKARVVITSSTADQLLVAAPGAGKQLWVSDYTISNYHASTTTEVHLKSASTIFWTASAPFKGGNERILAHPISCSENEALYCASVDSIDRVTVCVNGYTRAIIA